MAHTLNASYNETFVKSHDGGKNFLTSKFLDPTPHIWRTNLPNIFSII